MMQKTSMISKIKIHQWIEEGHLLVLYIMCHQKC